MVGRPVDQGERAQLILVGAIALAFLIFGIIVVFNSAVYTQTAGQDGALERAGEPAAVEAEIDAGAREVVGAVNADQNTTVERNESNESNESANGEGEELEEGEQGDEEGTDNESNENVSQVEDVNETIEAVDGNLTAFESHYRNATAAGRPVLADIDLGVNESAIGTIVHQREPEDLSGDGNRSVLEATGEPHDVQRFELALNVSEFEGLTVELSDREVELGRTGDNVTISEGGSMCQLEPAEPGANRTVTIEFLNGETDAVADEDCLADLDLAGNEDRIGFSGGDDATGTFELVVGTNPENQEIESEFAFKPAVLSVEGTLTYESDELTYVREIEIDVYGDGS